MTFEVALTRPENWRSLTPSEQWAIDKRLGVLDWSGNCPHRGEHDGLCPICKKIWDARFGKPES